MSPPGPSWHVPYIHRYNVPNPDQCLNVVLLQRVADEEFDQIVDNLRSIDEDWINTLDVPKPPSRTLQTKKWIRDYWPSSDVILEIARVAYSSVPHLPKFCSLIFVDSGWEAGNCIAARWEGDGDNSRMNAVRVPMNIAKTLLSACDANEGHTLSSILGIDTFEDAKVDFYVDATSSPWEEPEEVNTDYKLPESIPQDLALTKDTLIIISLKELTQDDIENVVREVVSGAEAEDATPPIKIFNGDGSHTSRTDMRNLFYRIHQNSDEANSSMPLFFVDYLLEQQDGKPQLLLARQSNSWRQQTLELMPAKTEKVLRLWHDATDGQLEEDLSETEEFVDIWNTEYVFDLDVHKNFDEMRGAPVFYLQQFTLEQERIVRSRLRELNDIEADEDWGQDWIYFGYIFPDDGQKHSMEDLRDLFESCDHSSPQFDSQKPGPYRLYDYPHHFIAVDDKILEDDPQVWLASSLDFHFDDVSDDLGWTYGLIPAKEAHLDWVNLDIANMGPNEQIDEPKRLWLTDLKEAKKEWENLYEEELREQELEEAGEEGEGELEDEQEEDPS